MTKIKLIVSDFDGVLANLQEAHYESLNDALATIDTKYLISHEDQIHRFEGLATRKKLEILHQERGLPVSYINEVFDLKQKLTAEAIEKSIKYDSQLVSTFSKLKNDGYKLYVASNAIRSTITAGLQNLGIYHFFDKILSNEDVKLTKPHPEIYLRCIIDAGVDPQEAIIIEDSKTGRHGAIRSGAHICTVDCPSDTTYEHIRACIQLAENNSRPLRWVDRKLNILLPCAGAGARMRAKYLAPKPLIDVAGKLMIQRVVDNLNIDANYIFVVQQEHYEKYNLGGYLKLIVPNCHIIQTDGLTEGAACTTLLAKDLINNDNHLLIANADQLLEWNSSDFMYHLLQSKADGSILTFQKENDPKWSYVKLNEAGYVCEVAEKKPISNKATTGIYAWKKGSDYVKYAEQMIAKNIRTNSEFYVAPVYNQAIQDNKKITTFDIQNMHGVGTIEDLQRFLDNIENIKLRFNGPF